MVKTKYTYVCLREMSEPSNKLLPKTLYEADVVLRIDEDDCTEIWKNRYGKPTKHFHSINRNIRKT